MLFFSFFLICFCFSVSIRPRFPILTLFVTKVSEAPNLLRSSSPLPAGLAQSYANGGQGQRRAAVARGSTTDLGNGTYLGSWRCDQQGAFALHVYLAVGGGTLRDSDSGGASPALSFGGVYGDYEGGGAWAGGAGFQGYDPRYSGLPVNGNGGLLGTYFDSSFLEPGTESFTRVDP